MYPILLAIHSLFRWLVLVSLLYALYRSYRGWLFHKPFLTFDNTVRQTTTNIANIQLLLGIALYYISPITTYFLDDFSQNVHERELRFFGMEHSTMMLIGIIMISIGANLSKRKTTDKQQFKTMAIWLSIALFIIFLSIPWPFSPFTARPFFRPI